MSLIKQQKSRILHSFSCGLCTSCSTTSLRPNACVAMLLVRVVGALSPWFTFAATMGVDLVLLQVWFDGLTAVVALVAVRVHCVFPCQFSMFSTFIFVFCKRKINKK